MILRRTELIAATTSSAIGAAAACLQQGGLVAFPTETVYGLGADATNPQAVAGIYHAKGRPSFNPLIVHVADMANAKRYGHFSDIALQLAKAFWPGPLTLVVPHTGNICDLARAGLDSVALRVPASPVARALIAAAKCPVAAPSANVSGHVSAVTAHDVMADLDGRIDMVLDGGASLIGLESTIIDCLTPVPCLLRPGGITAEAIQAKLQFTLDKAEGKNITAPGQMVSHYAPKARLRLNAAFLLPKEAGLDFGGHFAPAPTLFDLSPAGSLPQAAVNLFSALRLLDAHGAQNVAVAPIPLIGLGVAINDRLGRAAAAR